MTTRCECSIFLLCTKRSLNEIGMLALCACFYAKQQNTPEAAVAAVGSP